MTNPNPPEDLQAVIAAWTQPSSHPGGANVPPHIKAEWQAAARRRVREVMPGLAEALDRAAEHAGRFVCPRCGAASSEPEDLAHGYCGRCHDFTGTPGERPVPWRDVKPKPPDRPVLNFPDEDGEGSDR